MEQVLESLAGPLLISLLCARAVKTASSEGRTELIDLVNELFELKRKQLGINN